MSFNNTHMREENMINFGVRHDTVKLSTNKSVLRPEEETYLHLTAQLADIHTWEQLRAWCVTPDLYGGTKVTDFWLLAGYFYEGLNIAKASREIGYVVYIDKDGHINGGNALTFRLRRLNIKHPFYIIKALIDKRLIPTERIQSALEIEKQLTRGDMSARRGKFYKYYAKWFINDGLTWFASKNHTDPFKDLSNYLGISEAAINFWSTMPVEEVRITHQQGE